MKSLTRFLAIALVFFAFALSCPANATNTEETKTFVQADFSDVTLEVADFSFILKQAINNDYATNKQNKDAVFDERLELDIFVLYGYSHKNLVAQEFTKIKRFPLARDYL